MTPQRRFSPISTDRATILNASPTRSRTEELEEHARFASVAFSSDVLKGLKKKMSNRLPSLRTQCQSDQRRQEPLSIPRIRHRLFSSVAVSRASTHQRNSSAYLSIVAIHNVSIGATHANHVYGENHRYGISRIGRPTEIADGVQFVVSVL